MPYSSILDKYTECIDCNDGVLKPTIAGRCKYFHYKIYRGKIQVERQRNRSKIRLLHSFPANKSLVEKNITQNKNEWYKMQRDKMTGVCCNCGGKTSKDNDKYWKWSICHVLPKEHFLSIARHDSNWIEMCLTCHSAYDRNWLTAEKMPVFALAKKKFELLKDKISQDELRRIPECFLKLEPLNQCNDNILLPDMK